LDQLAESIKVQSSGLAGEIDEINRDMKEIEKKISFHKRSMSRAYVQWAQSGGGIPLDHVAKHIRGASKLPAAMQVQELASYGTLKAPLKVHEDPQNDMEIQENMFSKIMFQFYKRAMAQVREVQTDLKKAEQEAKNLALFFGFDESRMWEEMLSIFNDFRDKFIKAKRELDDFEKKEHRKELLKQQKEQLQTQLANKKKPEEVAKMMGKSINPAAAAESEKTQQEKKKMEDMYMKYKQKEKEKKDHEGGKMWV